MLIERMLRKVRKVRENLYVPASARAEERRERSVGLAVDPGIERTVAESIAWLCHAQDHSTTKDGGVSYGYSLRSGWGPSYPETTGYIIPTLLAFGENKNNEALMQRSRKMLDWLVRIQFPEGGFQGGKIDF